MSLKHYTIGERKFGVEFEIAGMSTDRAAAVLTAAGIPCIGERYNHSTRTHWKAVTDGSVTGGCEVVSPVLSGEEGIAQVRRVCEALTAAGGTVDARCGFHVHLDATGMNLAAIKRLFKLWMKYEDAIDCLVAKSRRSNANEFCRSNLGRFGSIRDEVSQVATCREAFRAIDHCRSVDDIAASFGRSRYFKLNVMSYWRHGTFEVRQHQGTLNADKAENWIRLMGAMFTAAVELRSVSPRRANGQTSHYRLKWFFNTTIQGGVRRFFSRRAAEFRRKERQAAA